MDKIHDLKKNAHEDTAEGGRAWAAEKGNTNGLTGWYVPVNKHNYEGQMVCIWHKPPACELLLR